MSLLLLWIVFLPVQIDSYNLVGFRFAISDLFVPFLVFYAFMRKSEFKINLDVIPYISVLVALFFVSSIISFMKIGSFNNYLLVKTVGLIYLIVVFLLIVSLIKDEEKLLKVIKYLLVSSFLWNTISIVGYFIELHWRIPTPFLAFEDRLVGLLVDPNAYGGYLISIFLLQSAILIGGNRVLPFWLMRINAVLLFLGIILTSSRSAWIGLIFGLVVLVWFYRGRFSLNRSTIYAGLVILFMFILLGSNFIERFISFSLRSYTIEERLELIEKGMQSFWNSSIFEKFFGIGLGIFMSISKGAIVHNMYIQYLIEIGILGFLALVALLFRGGLNYWKYIKYAQQSKSLAVGLFAGYIGMLGFALGIEALYQRHLWLLLALSEVFRNIKNLKRDADT